jgi:hypothetical protein
MANIMAYRRVEILTGTERRRNYTPGRKRGLSKKHLARLLIKEGSGPAAREPYLSAVPLALVDDGLP